MGGLEASTYKMWWYIAGYISSGISRRRWGQGRLKRFLDACRRFLIVAPGMNTFASAICSWVSFRGSQHSEIV
jgi:hypothetical protein